MTRQFTRSGRVVFVFRHIGNFGDWADVLAGLTMAWLCHAGLRHLGRYRTCFQFGCVPFSWCGPGIVRETHARDSPSKWNQRFLPRIKPPGSLCPLYEGWERRNACGFKSKATKTRYAGDPVRPRRRKSVSEEVWQQTTVASSVRGKTSLRSGSVQRRHLPRTDRCPKSLP